MQKIVGKYIFIYAPRILVLLRASSTSFITVQRQIKFVRFTKKKRFRKTPLVCPFSKTHFSIGLVFFRVAESLERSWRADRTGGVCVLVATTRAKSAIAHRARHDKSSELVPIISRALV